MVIKEDSDGSSYPNTSVWSGVIGRLQRGEADIGVPGFGISSRRLTAVDFSIPVFTADIRLFIKKPDTSKVKWNAYFEVFDEFWFKKLISIYSYENCYFDIC